MLIIASLSRYAVVSVWFFTCATNVTVRYFVVICLGRLILMRSVFADFGNKMKYGSYIASLGRKRTLALATVNYLRAEHWLDRHTAGVTLEFVLYNADVNLGCLVQVFWQFPPGGGAKSDVNINSMRLYRSTSSGLYIFVLIFELLYLVYTLYMIVHEIRQIRRRKWRYLRSISGCIDLSACVLSVVVIALYLTFLIEVGDLMSRYKSKKEIVGYFSYLVNLDTAIACVFGFLLVVGMLKFLHLLRFNPLIWRFFMVLRHGMKLFICALCIIVVNFVIFQNTQKTDIHGDSISTLYTLF